MKLFKKGKGVNCKLNSCMTRCKSCKCIIKTFNTSILTRPLKKTENAFKPFSMEATCSTMSADTRDL